MPKSPNSPQRGLTRRDFISTSLKVGAAAFTTGLLPRLRARAAEQYNVLFIMADDLRPMLGCYGYPEMHTPNIDALAERGTLFTRAYCQYPLCNPSRASLLTGLRPETTRVNSNSADFRKSVPHAATFSEYFAAHGYHTQSIGKIEHINQPFKGGPSWQALDVTDDELEDGKTANKAAEALKELKEQQFFLAVGFDKPHLPFYAPRKYYEVYNLEDKQERFRLPATSSYPKDSPEIARNSLRLFSLFRDIPAGEGPFSDAQTLGLIRAYAACTTYMDAQVGSVLHQLETLGLTEKTVVVFCGDHGFHLGEHGTWRKNTLFEVGLRSPLIVSMPGQAHSGVQTDALVELVDIYPTLCDACQLPIPESLEGTSMVPLIEEPIPLWKSAAFSKASSGRSIRTARYRYTEWGSNGRRGKELYDYHTDPHETRNVVNRPDNAELVAHLSERLHDGWERALPGTQEHVPVPQTLPEDVNNDGVVDIRDLVRVSNRFGESGGTAIPEDVNNDGVVDIRDLVRVANHFGKP